MGFEGVSKKIDKKETKKASPEALKGEKFLLEVKELYKILEQNRSRAQEQFNIPSGETLTGDADDSWTQIESAAWDRFSANITSLILTTLKDYGIDRYDLKRITGDFTENGLQMFKK